MEQAGKIIPASSFFGAPIYVKGLACFPKILYNNIQTLGIAEGRRCSDAAVFHIQVANACSAQVEAGWYEKGKRSQAWSFSKRSHRNFEPEHPKSNPSRQERRPVSGSGHESGRLSLGASKMQLPSVRNTGGCPSRDFMNQAGH